MADSSQPKPDGNFSLVTALSDAFTYVIQDFSTFLRVSWKFLVFVVASSAILFTAIGLLAREQNEVTIYVIVGIGLLLAFLTSNAFYIVVVRNWLLGEAEPKFLRTYGAVIFRAIILTLLILITVVAVFVPPFAGGVAVIAFLTGAKSDPSVGVVILAVILLIALVIAALLIAIYLVGRLCLWLVAGCAGTPLTLGQSWQATKGAGLRIMTGMLALSIAFLALEFGIEAAVSPLLGVSSETFEKIGESDVPLYSLFGLLLIKILIYFPQTAASMVYCASVYRQTSGG